MKADPRYDPDELVAFLNRIKARVTQATTPNLVSMHIAVKAAQIPIPEFIELLLNGELKSVGWDETGTGLAAIRVDPDELIARVRVPDDLLSLRTVELRISTSFQVTKALINEHRIPAITRRNPITGRPQTVVTEDDFAAFHSTYLSLRNIAKGRATTTIKCRKLLMTLGVAPAFFAANMAFYRRSDLPAH